MGTGRGENIGKPFYFNLPPDIGFTLFTPIKGRIDSLTVYIDKAETCTNILRYNTCRSSYPEDQKVPITELKWDARTVTDIPGNNAYWFFALFWLTKGSRNKN